MEDDKETLEDLALTVAWMQEAILRCMAENKVLEADLQATRSMAWVCLTSSPEAIAMLERERPNFRQCLQVLGLNEGQVNQGVAALERQLLSAQQEPRRGLPAFVRGLCFDLLATLEGIGSPSRWTWESAAILAGVAFCAWLLG